jgi:RNA polymerase sigma factor (sigma-70 family)
MSAWVSVRFLQTQSDARLLALARAGHERAFEALVHRYRKPLLAYCRRMPVPGATAEDAVQQGLLQAWVALQRGAEVRDVQAWLYRVVHNVTLRMLNASGSGHAELSESLVGADPPQSELERRLNVRATLAGVAALPPLQREALIRTAVEGLSYEQVAAMLGLSDGAVRGLVYRARRTLRDAASALTPFPVVEWAASAGRRGAQLTERLGELVGGGGATGLGSLVKGGATVTAGEKRIG